ncbi:MAG: membrane protein insertase YidC [Bifidobacteriaceae bacterium]|jgi:YidC/Oxa1 family membrane protein insertase|nr:membrane protein insertase YidC [Bifidobacteriaceae bacterium]
MGWFDSILTPIMWCVAWIMYGAHKFFSLIRVNNSVAWMLAIVVLVVVMRCIMIPLFVKQIKSSRNMQLIQPEVQKIQRRYKGKTDPVSRRRQQEEMMEVYRKAGSNPLSGCWPILAQSPLFFALFRVLYNLGPVSEGTYKKPSIGPIDAAVAKEIVDSHMFGAPLSATFMNPATWAGASALNVRIVTVVLIILMSITTFTTQRQLTMKNMPQSALDNPMFRTQKIMMYMMPVIFAVSGVNFPIGVLIYWLTTNLWSMGQQFIVIRNMPAPGSEAERRMQARKAKKHPELADGDKAADGAGGAAGATPTTGGQRQQPKRTTRSQRKSSGSAAAGQSSAGGGEAAAAEEPVAPEDESSGDDTATTPTPLTKPKPASGQRPQPKSTSRKKRKK